MYSYVCIPLVKMFHCVIALELLLSLFYQHFNRFSMQYVYNVLKHVACKTVIINVDYMLWLRRVIAIYVHMDMNVLMLYSVSLYNKTMHRSAIVVKCTQLHKHACNLRGPGMNQWVFRPCGPICRTMRLQVISCTDFERTFDGFQARTCKNIHSIRTSGQRSHFTSTTSI